MKRQSVIHGSVILMASVIFAKVCGALFRIPLTQMLGGTGMGYFSSAYALFLPVFALSVTGMNTAVAAMTAEAWAASDHAMIRIIRSCAFRLFGGIGICGSLLLAFCAEPLCVIILNNPPAAAAVKALSPTVCICCLSAVLRGSFEGLRSMTPTALSQSAEGMIRVICGVTFCGCVLSGQWQGLVQEDNPTAAGAAAAVFGVTVSALAGLILLFCFPFPVTKGGSTHIGRRTVYRRLIRILIPVAISSLITNLTTLTDVFTVLRCLTDVILKAPQRFGYTSSPTPAEAAETANFLYGAFSGLAVTVFNLVPSVTNMMGKSVLPAFTEACTQKDSAAMERHARTALSGTAFLALPAGMGIFVLAEPILTLLFPKRIAEVAAAAPPLMILGIAVIFLAMTHPIFSMLQAAGRADLTVRIMLWGAAAKILGNLVLLRMEAVHLNGAAIATLLCYMVTLFRASAVLKQQTRLSLSLMQICGRPLLAGILCAAAAKTVYQLLADMGSAAALLLGIGAGGMIYLLSMWLMRRKTSA